MERIKVRFKGNNPNSGYGYYRTGDIGYIVGYTGGLAVVIKENGSFVKTELSHIEEIKELKQTNVKPELETKADNPETIITPIFQAGDIIINKTHDLIFEIDGIDTFNSYYLVKNRPGLTIPFGFQDNYELMSDNAIRHFYKKIRKQIISEIKCEQMVLDYAKDASVSPYHYSVDYYRKGIEDAIKAIKGE